MQGSAQLFISAGTLSLSFGLASAGAGRAHPDTSEGPALSDGAGSTFLWDTGMHLLTSFFYKVCFLEGHGL